MKKIIYILTATLLIASCAKSEVAYEGDGGELSFAPVSHLSTKGAIISNTFPTTDHIALFAYHNPLQTPTNVTDFSAWAENEYLYDAEFFYNTASPTDKEGVIAWSGLETVYYWPITGSLVFAGYSLPAPEVAGQPSPSIGTASYNLVEDVLKIEGYEQSANTAETFDLLYFGTDGKSYNNRRTGTAVPVKFNHALAWITINVKGGDGALIPEHVWKIKDLTLKDVNTKGDFTFNGTPTGDEVPVKWDLTTDIAPMPIFKKALGQDLTSEFVRIENEDYGTVVIPQAPKLLSVTLTYKSPANDDITEIFDIDLGLGEGVIWEAGKRYVYNLTFSPVEIKVAPEVTVWPATGEEGYVETEIEK